MSLDAEDPMKHTNLFTLVIAATCTAILGLPAAVEGQPRSKDDITVVQVTQTANRYLRSREYGKAESAFREVVERAPQDAEGHEGLGKALEGQKRWRDAIVVYEAALKSVKPTWYRGYYRLAYAQRKAGQPTEAAANYEKYIANIPNDPDAHYGLGVAYDEAGNGAGALAAFRKYVEIETRPTEQKWIDQANDAIARLEKTGVGETPAPEAEVATADPPPEEMPIAHETVAEHLKKGDGAMATKAYAEAANHYAAAAEQSETGVEAHYKLGAVRAIRGDLPGAIDAWQTVAQRDPKMTKASDNIRRAKARLLGSTEGRVDDPALQGELDAKLTLADRYLGERRPWMALRVLDSLVREVPANGKARALRGRTFMALGRYREAAQELELALSYSPADSEILGALGLTYTELAEAERARYFLVRYLDKVDPRGGDAAKEPYRVALGRLGPR